MKFSVVAAACLQLSAGLAAPVAPRELGNGIQIFHEGGRGGDGARGGDGGARGNAGGNAGGEAGGEGGEAGEGGEGEGEENELEIEAQFDEAVTLQGGDIKQDTLYPPGTNGVFEVEFQNTAGNTLAVTENPTPAAPPAGFSALEPVSYIVALADDTTGATLQKIDYILTAGNALDISKGKVGKLDAATQTFVIDETVGELEFEVEENELTLTVADLNGEWAIFVPDAAAGGGEAGNAEGGEGGEGEGAENEVELEAQFDEAVALQGGDIKQDTLYPPGTNGVFEVEFQNTAGNTLTVTENPAPAAPPAGFSALEPVSYVVALADDSAGATLQKIDYILTAGNTLDISKGKVGKLDAATQTFIIDDTIGELEFEVEENELTLSVADLNGEWAIFVPAAAAGGDAGAGAGAGAGGEAGAGSPTTGNSILDSVLKLIGEGAAAADAAAAAAAAGNAA